MYDLEHVFAAVNVVLRYVKNGKAKQLAYFIESEFDQTPLTEEILLEEGFVADQWGCLHLQVGGFELAWWESSQTIALEATETGVKNLGDLRRLIDLLANPAGSFYTKNRSQTHSPLE